MMAAAESQKPEYSMESIIGKKTIAKLLEVAGSVAAETQMRLNDDGYSIRLVDPANVACVFVDLEKPAFESYHSEGGLIGYDIGRLDDVIGFGDSGDLVHLRLNSETRMLDVEINNFDYECALIDPESVRGEPDMPDGLDEKLHSEIVVEAGDLQDAVKAAELASDHILLQSDPDTGEFTISAEGDTDTSNVTFGPEEMIDGQTDQECESLFSLDYMKDISKPMPKDSEVTIRHGSEMPAKLEWEFAEGYGEVMAMLAPRIKTD